MNNSKVVRLSGNTLKAFDHFKDVVISSSSSTQKKLFKELSDQAIMAYALNLAAEFLSKDPE